MPELADWFLTAEERGNPTTTIPAWCAGSRAEPLIHGATYFDRLVSDVEVLGDGDYLFFTDWRGDPDEKMRDDGPTVSELFCAAAERGVVVKGLMWRSHLDKLAYSEEENRHLGESIEQAGGEVLLDQRVRFGGSHHQKLVVIRHPRAPERDVAFAGGIDLCHSRRDDENHRGDRQAQQISPQYGDHPPWHDVQLRLQGPVVGALDTTFRERWNDPAPLDMLSPVAWLTDKLRGADLKPDPLPDPAAGSARRADRTPCRCFAPIPTHTSNTTSRRTASAASPAATRRRFPRPGNSSTWRTSTCGRSGSPSCSRARWPTTRSFIWSRSCHAIPTSTGDSRCRPTKSAASRPSKRAGRADPDRVHIFDVENHEGTPVYVHAKVCVIDDIWATVGSDNLNRRSWTHDSELSCAVLDETGEFAQDLRLRLIREHLDLAADGSADDGIVGLDTVVEVIESSALALEQWHVNGRTGPRPPGRLRPHRPEKLGKLTRSWAEPAYRAFYDPDGRSYRARLKDEW